MADKRSIRELIPEKSPQQIEISPEELHKSSLYRPDLPAKVIVTTNVHHRDTTGRAITEDCRFVRHLESKDDAFKRNLIVGQNWIEIDTAWVKNIGYFFLRNNGGKPFNVVPTPEQVEEALSRIVEVGYRLKPIPEREDNKIDDTTVKPIRTMWDKRETDTLDNPIVLWIVHPGEQLQGRPVNEHKMYLRCRNGETSVTLFVLPG